VLDYRGQNLTRQDGKVYVSTDVSIRLVSEDKDMVWSDETVKRIRMKKSEQPGLVQKAGLNIVKCPFCGASIDLQAKRCSYCGTAFLYERPLNIESVSTLPGSS
jgi:ribosomal protein L24E